MEYRSKFGSAAAAVAVVLALTGSVWAYQAARVMPSGKIKVYRNGTLSQVLRESAPLPTGALLKPDGNCGVRLENVYLVAEDGSEFGVHNESRPVRLALNKGKFYFAVNPSTGRMEFQTPAGDVTAQQFQIQAAAEGTLKGFVEVADGATTLGVLEGGAMVVSTLAGEQTIAAGSQIRLTQADLLNQGDDPDAPPAGAGAKPQAGKIPRETLISAGVLALYGGAGIWMIQSSDPDDRPAPASPAQP